MYVIEHCGFGNLPRMVRQHHYRKSEKAGLSENPLPPALYAAWDQKMTGMLTGAAPHCRPMPGGTSLALRWSVIAVKAGGNGGVGPLM